MKKCGMKSGRLRRIDVECRYVIGRCILEKINEKTVILKNEGEIESIYNEFIGMGYLY